MSFARDTTQKFSLIGIYIFRALKNKETFFDYEVDEAKCNKFEDKEEKCELDICTYDTINNKCKPIDYRLFKKVDLDDESYKFKIVYRNVTADDNIKPSEYSDDISMAHFNGKDSYIYISEFIAFTGLVLELIMDGKIIVVRQKIKALKFKIMIVDRG